MLKNLHIGVRLAIGFGLALLAVAVIAGLGYSRISALNGLLIFLAYNSWLFLTNIKVFNTAIDNCYDASQ